MSATILKYSKAAEEINWEFLQKTVIKDKLLLKHKSCSVSQEVYAANLLNGSVKCQHCKINGYKVNAEVKGWQWLCMENHTYSFYRHSCGHEQSISTVGMASQFPVCVDCQNRKLESEADSLNWKFLGKVDKQYAQYSHNACGKIKLLQPVHVRKGFARCDYCLSNERQQSAQGQNFDYVEDVNGCYAKYKHSCGAFQNFQYGAMRHGEVKCNSCFENQLKHATLGTEWSWQSRHKEHSKSVYKHICGHFQTMSHDKIKDGCPCCQGCGNNWYDLPSEIYILKFSNITGSAIKLGFAKSKDNRMRTFKTKENVKCEVLFSKKMHSGRSAILAEKHIHKVLRHLKLPNEVGKEYVLSGFTEFYPEEHLSRIQDEIDLILK